MPQPLSERTASFTDSVIRRMTRVSLKYGAVNLSQGFPDFEPPQAILERLAQVAREDGSVNCLDEEVALRQGDMITLTMADGHPLQLRFEWE